MNALSFDMHRAAAVSPMSPDTRPLAGANVLVVEDNWMIAAEITDVLEEAGACVVGPFPNMVDALESLTDLLAIDGAILDIGLGDDVSYPLAEALKTTRVPFMFLTGVERGGLPERFRQVPHMLKPMSADMLVRALVAMGLGKH